MLKKLIFQTIQFSYTKMSSQMEYMIRASQVLPFNKDKVVNYLKEMIYEYAKEKENLSVQDRCHFIERIMYAVFEHPEIISRYPKFRNMIQNKYFEFIIAIQHDNLKPSQIISDIPFVINIIKSRSDYVNNAIPEQVPTHNYNLRSTTRLKRNV